MHLARIETHGYRSARDAPLECDIPGRFAVLAGGNSHGKSTIVDSIAMSHPDVFPYFDRLSSAALARSVTSPTIDVTYELGPPGVSPLGDTLRGAGGAPIWQTALSSSMGRIQVNRNPPVSPGQLPVMYLSPTRDPDRDLAGRDSRVIVEMLKAQALRTRGDRSLGELRARLGRLIGNLTGAWPVRDAEERVAEHLEELTVGVAGRTPYLGTTTVDDTLLTRVFDFLMATIGESRANAYRIEGEGLGYANLLEIAVVLAAIPDLTHVPPPPNQQDPDDEADLDNDIDDDERREEMESAEHARSLEDETLFARQFHALVILEEPEAHLNTQLQHGLVQYLRQVVDERPEVQVIISTHSDQIVAACDPNELVVFTRSSGNPAARTIKSFGLPSTQLDQVRRHLDVARAAGLFADRLVLVEGITDALLVREFGRVWANGDRQKRRFIEALTIAVLGSRVGPWLPGLLTRPGHEISTKLAVLGDSDEKAEPRWVDRRRSAHFDAFWNEPTLEPSLVNGNEDLMAEVFDDMSIADDSLIDPDEITAEAVYGYFGDVGRRRKAEFAEKVADAVRGNPGAVTIPAHFVDLFEFVWDGFLPPAPEPDDEP
jgi:putative ATP-dependent endonuclease of OLD family